MSTSLLTEVLSAKYISEQGGTCKSVSSPSIQAYWATLDAGALAGALPRLAACFTAPRFKATVIAHELQSIDADHQRNQTNDNKRIRWLLKALSQKGHKWRDFGKGGADVLIGAAKTVSEEGHKPGENIDLLCAEVCARLVKWWAQECCAGRMTVAVIGRGTCAVPRAFITCSELALAESLRELAQLVSSSFSAVANRGVDPRPEIPDPVWGPGQHGVCLIRLLRLKC